MILTLTPNPTVDRVIFVRGFRLGAVIRAEREVVVPSGKGVGASLVIRELNGETLVLGLQAGHTGKLHCVLLEERGVPYEFVPAKGETRTCIVLVDVEAGQQSSIAAPTLQAAEEHLSALLERQARLAPRSWGIIYGGTLPAGMPCNSYARLIRQAHELGLVTLLDSSGEALRQGVAGRPHILKVNCEELATLDPALSRLGPPQELTTALSQHLGEWASEGIILTLGRAGALAVTAEGNYLACPPEVPVINTAGAGDALGGALMLARSRGFSWTEALRLGTAAAAAVVMNEGTAICQREQVEELLPQVKIVPL